MDDLASPTEVTSSNPLRCQHRPEEQERLQRRDELAPQPKEQAATKKDRPDRAPHAGLTPRPLQYNPGSDARSAHSTQKPF